MKWTHKNRSKIKPASLAVFFLCIYPWSRYSLSGLIDLGGPYALYIFEIFLGLFGLLLMRPGGLRRSAPHPIRLVAPLLAAGFGTGLIVFLCARIMGLAIPFDLNDKQTIFALLIIAPIVEELIFRGLLWRSMEILKIESRHIMWITTLLFALAHFEAFSRVGAEIKIYVLYQTVYVIPLSILCASARLRSLNIYYSVSVHFLFNLAFYLGSYIL